MNSVLIERLPDSISVKYRETVPAEDSYYLIKLKLERFLGKSAKGQGEEV